MIMLYDYDYNFIQLLKNMFKVCLNWKNAVVIRYKLTWLVSL